jgi:hypothetical protein
MRAVRFALALLAALAAAPSRAEAHPRCGTIERLPSLASQPRPPRIFLGGGEKATRDSFGGDYQIRESANFALKWTTSVVDEDEAAMALAVLEDSWRLYIDELGHTPPPGAESYRVNAYVSGLEDVPSIDFDGGYAWIDDEGYAYLVVSRNMFTPEQGGDTLRTVLSHEFHHDIQLGLDVFNAGSAYWFWEASADWAAQELYPEMAYAYGFVGAFAMRAELPVFYAGDALGGDVSGLHQYGASIFPRHLSERWGDPTLVSGAWETAGPADDPLEIMGGLLPEGDIAAAYAEFAPRMALWDFERQDLIIGWVDAYGTQFPDGRFAHRVPAEGTGGWIGPPPGREPRAWGASVIEVARPASGLVAIEVEAETTGSSGIPGLVQAVVVRYTEDGIAYEPIELAAGAGAATVPLLTTGYLVLFATADTRSFSESYSYQVRITPDAVPGADAGPGGEEAADASAGCGCQSGRGRGGWLAFLLLAYLISLAWRGRQPR